MMYLLFQPLIFNRQPFNLLGDLELRFTGATWTNHSPRYLLKLIVFIPKNFVLHFQPIVLFFSTYILLLYERVKSMVSNPEL
jgi:hypothetical protein